MSERIAPGRQEHRRETLATMAVFIVRRLLFGLFILAVISYLTYLGLDLAAGAPPGQVFLRAARSTALYWTRLFSGDLGTSSAGSVTYAVVQVAEVVPGLLAKSLGLLSISLLLASLVGVLLGIAAARYRHTGWSLFTLLLSIIGVSIPSFFAALILQLLIIRWTRLSGRPLLPIGGFGWDERIILPALVLAARPVAQIARVTYVTLGGLLDQDFIRTAHSKGLPPWLTMWRHTLRNAAVPILTTVGVSLRFSLSSLPVVEFFFNWTGIGFTLLKSIAGQDYNMTLVLILCLGVLFILLNLLLEIVYRLVDPRLRTHAAENARQEREGLLSILRAVAIGFGEWIRAAWPGRRLAARRAPSQPSPFQAVLAARGITVGQNTKTYLQERRRSWIRGTVSNLPFVLGLALVFILVALVVLGPHWTPHSPYTKRGLEYIAGKLSVPPFAPDEAYPWGTDPLGRDVMSLVMAGAQQTLIMAALVVLARLSLGLVLGSLAGWLSGSWVDRFLLGLIEVLAAFPALLIAMTLILALGIRRGFLPFVVALSLIGWGEIMQFVRGQVMSIRVKPFIESAVAVGQRTPRLIWSHVMPNLFSALISIAALEMGAVLMLLGELGFVGIFIGGGAFAELQINAPPYHYSDVPEWGALLSNVRLYARSYPWTAVYPALAFFISILGFNLLGEGVRRMVETVGLRLTRLVNRYTLGAILLVTLGAGWARSNTGAAAYYRQQATAFDGDRAMAYVQTLADPVLEGRALGTAGQVAAEEQIAQWFHEAGLQPGGQELTYFQSRYRSAQTLDAVPRLTVEGKDAGVYRQDYVEYPGFYRNRGAFEGPLRILATGRMTLVQTTLAGSFYISLRDVDLSDDVVMVLSDRDAGYLQRLRPAALLVVADNDQDIAQRRTLSTLTAQWQALTAERAEDYETPMLWISEAAANRMLSDAGLTVAELRRQAGELGQDEVLDRQTDLTVSMEVQGTILDKIPVRNVIGHLPGESNSQYGGINAETIVVLAQYDGPSLSPDGVLYPAANDNATGVATLIEVVRAMQESGYQPYRTFLFIAYSGEGLEGGEPIQPADVSKFLQAHHGFSSSLQVEAVVHLRGLAGEQGDQLVLSATGSRRLLQVFQRAARQMGVPARTADDHVDMSIIFEEKSAREGGQQAPGIQLGWEGWEKVTHTSSDTVEALSTDRLERAGRVLTLALMSMGRELRY